MSRKRRRPPRSEPLPWGSIYPTLDLHGDTADRAVRRTERWLDEQRLSGTRTVRVVTGRGLHSVGPPVLRGEVEALLGALRGGLVRRFAAEPGGGAYRVELLPPSPAYPPSSPSSRRPPRPPRRADADAELRRRAEETLSELGVQPTPELIEIEIRRLRRLDGDGGA